MTDPTPNIIMLTDRTRFGNETGAGIMRNRCAFTSRDMAHDWPEAFTYAIVWGWHDDDDPDEDVMPEIAEKFEWDAELIAFLRDAHERFTKLAEKREDREDD